MGNEFEDIDFWKAIILYGLNNATYKIALGKALLELSSQERTSLDWDELSEAFFIQYLDRLDVQHPLPQQSNPARQTVMERIVREYQNARLTQTEAVQRVGRCGFNDVIPRFQTIGKDKALIAERFYEFDFGKRLILKDPLLSIAKADHTTLLDELNARWSLLEGAFSIYQENWQLSNDIRQIYLLNGYQRTDLTSNIPFLQGYQGNVCFYCGEAIESHDVHVDHVLPRQVLQHDEVWNLVLSHSHCNVSKSDKLVGNHYLEKLIKRNENIMGSNHPWKKKIEITLGNTPKGRRKALSKHYENVKSVLGAYYWGGVEGYSAEQDAFYRKLITKLNNG
ncbi:HNH endonuclease domain-containing protein [Catalinimonas sp. 4WD22]|uniref:HNH endonuclease n=1 Tax=Catalinimonas locisalis TaxID=3133978 RepID=UPI00310127F3